MKKTITLRPAAIVRGVSGPSGATFATPGPPSWATLDASTGHFHQARLPHTGVLICRHFCLGLGRDVGGRVRCALMGRDQLQERG
jgi:hypothetical protein